MALTRKMLSAMGIEEDKADEIIKAHTETVDALKEQADSSKTDAAELEKLKEQVKSLKSELAEADKSDWEKKYNDLKSEYDEYKTDIENKATRSSKEAAYKQLLIDAGISEKRIATILKVSDIDGVELDKEGNIKSADKLTASIKEEWADFIVTKHEEGAETPKPPAKDGKGGTMTKDDILKIRDTADRQAAMKEHPELFGIEVN